ncbi:MAG: glycosyltransferase [Thermoguttaceae bacterium]
MRSGAGNTVALFVPRPGPGGAERITVHLANGLVRRGRRVDAVFLQAEGPFLADLTAEVRILDLNAPRLMHAIPRLAAYLRSARPEVLISALDYANVGAILANGLSRTNTPTVAAVHVTHSMDAAARRGIKQSILRTAIRWTYRRADAIVCVSQGVADDLLRVTRLPAEKVRVIYNPVVTPRLLELAREPVTHPWFAPGQPEVLVAVGSLTPPKDFATLIRAMALLRQNRAARLMILGEGPLRGALENLVRELGLQDCVALPGFDKNPYAYLARAAVFVLSSAWEALPTVLIEALAVGVPVVSTDCRYGPGEILDGGRYGRLVPVGDAEAMAQAVAGALRGPPPAVPGRALERYTLDFALDQYAQLLAEIRHG